ncbi:hypothetical protein [Polaribacter ponticola]|uniref:Uncharacterized protein n=1 Tax=Polaribacter ponticola TaxID=2978475 RepID=A0ABT5S6J6_9FLAO|nr:hypothetical protein [Polaribacter sp. MSW5]MDD7913459.1 hypothetical protein [Polaribacter sp. MSW5]
MENVFKYYEFSLFKKDESGSFSGNDIAFTELNSTHFLIFEKKITPIICLFQSTETKMKLATNLQKY